MSHSVIANANRRKKKLGIITLDVIRQLVADLPGAREESSYGTPGFKVRKKLFARIHQKEDAIVVKADFDERENLMQTNPITYYLTDHYLKYQWVLVRIPTVRQDELRQLLVNAWRKVAPKNLIEEFNSR